MIIYPPYIDGVLPAFVDTIAIPYEMNPGVSSQNVAGFKLKLTDYLSSEVSQYDSGFTLNTLSFSGSKLNSGENEKYFKAQLAYKYNNNEIGPYSSVGIIKQIHEPVFNFNIKGNNIVFDYSTSNLESLKDCTIEISQDGQVIYTDTYLAQWNQSSYVWYYWFEPGKEYKVKVLYTTINLYSDTTDVKTVKYSGTSVDENDYINGIAAAANYDTGSIDLTINLTNVSLKIYRSTDETNLWEALAYLEELSSPAVYKDYFVEQGVKYSYRVISILNNETIALPGQINIEAEFEDVFLSDAHRNLRIRYNPKISSFKNTVLEQKTDTLGGKYPFFFRNGNTNYKEFTINGLISYWMDDNEDFISKEALGLEEGTEIRTSTKAAKISTKGKLPTTSLTDYNITAERKFKLEVLNWLNNGEPKVFRSPTEGTYFIRLNNISLSPEDGLGRMLHSFQATAYEIADTNIDEYHHFNLGSSSKLIAPEGGIYQSVNNLRTNKTLNWVKNIEIINFKGKIIYTEFGSNRSREIKQENIENIELNLVFQEVLIQPESQCDLIYIQMEGPTFSYNVRKEEKEGTSTFRAATDEFIANVEIRAGDSPATYQIGSGSSQELEEENSVILYFSEADNIQAVEIEDEFSEFVKSQTIVTYYSKIVLGGTV